MRWSLVIEALLIFLVGCATGKRILAFLPFPGKSHQMVFNPILRQLSENGHEILAYKGISMPKPHPKGYTEILAPNMMDNMKDNINFIEFGKLGPVSQLIALNEIGMMMCIAFYETEFFKNLMKTNEKYDLIIHEAFFAQESIVALAHKFNAPHIVLMPLGNSLWLNYMMDNPFSPTYIPDYKVHYTDEMNFQERVVNTYAALAAVTIGEWFYLPKHQSLADKYFIYPGSENRPRIRDILRNTSLAVINSNFVLNGAAPVAPNAVHVGGVHIEKLKPLPKDLQDWMDGAKDGVIYFSYGTVLQPDLIVADLESAFCAAFGKLKQRVIWKHNGEVKDKPQNVLITPWLPQQSILAHKNVRLFITHGGYLSISEAVNFGVPLVGTPFFGDQQKNIKTVLQKGIGVQLDYANITEKSISWAINEVLSNPSYRERIQALSSIFRDSISTSPLEEATYWVEFVMKHKGAPFLRPATSRLYWFQKYLLDVAALILATSALAFAILYLILRSLYRLLCVRSNKKISQKKKQ